MKRRLLIREMLYMLFSNLSKEKLTGSNENWLLKSSYRRFPDYLWPVEASIRSEKSLDIYCLSIGFSRFCYSALWVLLFYDANAQRQEEIRSPRWGRTISDFINIALLARPNPGWTPSIAHWLQGGFLWIVILNQHGQFTFRDLGKTWLYLWINFLLVEVASGKQRTLICCSKHSSAH